MERRFSFGSRSVGSLGCIDLHQSECDLPRGGGSAINFPGNLRFWPRVAFKMAATSSEMEDMKKLLSRFALLVKEEGPLGLSSAEELREVIHHQFSIRKHELFAYRSHPDPFVVIFSEENSRDVVFTAGRVIDGPLELSFNSWDLDALRDRVIIPYHIRLCLEGIPQHAWYLDIASKVLCDEVVIHHVEEETRRRLDQRAYCC
jgi:hypothetical protein